LYSNEALALSGVSARTVIFFIHFETDEPRMCSKKKSPDIGASNA
jgi:hypothetical protein